MKLLKSGLLLIAVTVSGCFLSCNSEEAGNVLNNEIQNSEYALSDAEAKELIISNFGSIATRGSETFELGERKSTRNYSITKEDGGAEIIPVYEYPVLKEETEGYSLVVADSRIPTVLAFVDYGSLADTLEIEPLNLYIKSIPQLLDSYLKVYHARTEEAALQTKAAGKVELRDTIDGFDIDCSTPVWWQGPPYNSNCSSSTHCPNYSSVYEGRYRTGCVPLALAEIMKYHIDNKGKSNIIQSQFGNSIGAFITDISIQVDVEYSCDYSGVGKSVVKSNSKNTLSYYGYTSNAWCDFESWRVEASLLSGYPVYVVGYTSPGPSEVGHAWVIDGEAKGDKLYYYFHMNWGWNGASNGYFNCGTYSLPTSLTTSEHTFLFSTFQILTNIH
jgi:hypothetical protein